MALKALPLVSFVYKVFWPYLLSKIVSYCLKFAEWGHFLP